MMCVQLLLTVWLSVVSIGAYFIIGMPLVAFQQVLVDTSVFVFAIHLPMAIVGWFTTRQHRWAIYTGFFLSLFNVLAPAAFFLTPSPPLYDDIYSRIAFSEYVAFLTCTLVLFAELGQIALYAAALAAWRTTRRHSP